MKTLNKAAALVLLLIASNQVYCAGKILPYPIYQNKMDNGLNVVTVPLDSPGLAAFYIITRVQLLFLKQSTK